MYLSEQSQGYSFCTTSVPPTTRVEVPFSPQLGKSSRTVRDTTVVAAAAAVVESVVALAAVPLAAVPLSVSPEPTMTRHEDRITSGQFRLSFLTKLIRKFC